MIGINNTGMTAGFYVDSGGTTHGFTHNGGFTTVDAPSTAFNQLLGINDGGTAVGYSSTDPTGMTLQMSFKEAGGAFSYITGFPASTLNNQAVGINNSGTAVGFYQDPTGVFHGYTAAGTSASTFDVSFAGAMGTQAFGINNHGEIVGDYTDSMGTMHGFVYIGGVFYTVDDPNGVAGSTVINGVNDLGQLVGFYADANHNTIGFVATVIPEPGTLTLLGTGMLAGLGLVRRRCRANSRPAFCCSIPNPHSSCTTGVGISSCACSVPKRDPYSAALAARGATTAMFCSRSGGKP